MADPLKTSDLQAPEEDIFGWNSIFVDNRQCPGQCLPMNDFERERECDQPKKKGASVNVLFDQGLKPGEVSVRIRTTTGDQLRDLQDFYLKYMDPERALSRRTVVTVAHPQLYARGVKAGYFFSAGPPAPTRDGGIWPLISTFKFKIVDPKTKITTSSGASKPKPKDQYVSQQITDTLRGSVQPIPTPGITSAAVLAGLPRPPNQPAPPLLTPQGLQKSAQTGNGLAQMVNRAVGGAAP